jgi:hypothetical protein
VFEAVNIINLNSVVYLRLKTLRSLIDTL